MNQDGSASSFILPLPPVLQDDAGHRLVFAQSWPRLWPCRSSKT
jgi:hypothetical protein